MEPKLNPYLDSISNLAKVGHLQGMDAFPCARSACTPRTLAQPLRAPTAGADRRPLPALAACSALLLYGLPSKGRALARIPASAPALRSAQHALLR